MTVDQSFQPSRGIALDRLARFVPRAGRDYANGRNTDPGPDQPGAVSRLSPYLRRRLITEREVVAAVLDRHSPTAAEKFIQEVLWRTYWKGWLEMRPAVWASFVTERDRARDAASGALALAQAESGATGIEGFDDWARELVATGYLHNHARMWFASIWIFTLRLPWALGADFFLRYLIDADPASNTLSWRWVAGLQTAGKTYLATRDNIARHTNGRFAPTGLATEAVALREPPLPAARSLPDPAPHDPLAPALLLVTDEDLHPESLFPGKATLRAASVIIDPALLWGDNARQFALGAGEDTAARLRQHVDGPVNRHDALDSGTLVAAARAAGVRHIVTPYAPVGPVADRIAVLSEALAGEGLTLTNVRRDWDDRFWPHASRGFFPFKERIAQLLRDPGRT